MLSTCKGKKEELRNNHSYLDSRFLCLIWSSVTQLSAICWQGVTQLIKTLARFSHLQKLFPLLLWRCHLLHDARNLLWLCSLRGKERNVWNREVWEDSSQQTKHHLQCYQDRPHRWASWSDLPLLVPSARADPLSPQNRDCSLKRHGKSRKRWVCDLPSLRKVPSRSVFGAPS